MIIETPPIFNAAIPLVFSSLLGFLSNSLGKRCLAPVPVGIYTEIL